MFIKLTDSDTGFVWVNFALVASFSSEFSDGHSGGGSELVVANERKPVCVLESPEQIVDLLAELQNDYMKQMAKSIERPGFPLWPSKEMLNGAKPVEVAPR